MRRHAGLNPHGQVPRSDHGRRRARVAHRLVAAAPARLLHHLRRRRRARGDVSASGRAISPKPPVVILGGAEAVQHHGIGRRDLIDMAARQSGPLALAARRRDARRRRLLHALRLVHHHRAARRSRTSGFCKTGEGGAFAQDGRIGLGGALPINTDGGGLSSNHPGMRGIFLVIEATKQLRGECGAAQVADCEIALCHGTGGMLGLRHSGVTMVLGRRMSERAVHEAAAAHRRGVEGLLGGAASATSCTCSAAATAARVRAPAARGVPGVPVERRRVGACERPRHGLQLHRHAPEPGARLPRRAALRAGHRRAGRRPAHADEHRRVRAGRRADRHAGGGGVRRRHAGGDAAEVPSDVPAAGAA